MPLTKKYNFENNKSGDKNNHLTNQKWQKRNDENKCRDSWDKVGNEKGKSITPELLKNKQTKITRKQDQMPHWKKNLQSP